MKIRLLSAALSLLCWVGGPALADEHEESVSYTRPGFYGAASFTFADTWDNSGVSTGEGFGLRLGHRFDQGDSVVGGGLEAWGRAVFTHSDDDDADVIPWTASIGPVLWYGQERFQPFMRLGIGISAITIDKGGSNQHARGWGVSFGTGAEYAILEQLAGYAMFEYESPLTNESSLDNYDSMGASFGLRYTF